MKKKKKWIAGITGILTAAACFLSGCSPASAAQKAAPSPVDAASADTDEMIFIGWNTDPKGNGTWYKENQNVGKLKDDLDLYAQWAKKVNDFDYTGKVQTFTAPADGTYKLETWGAQGGSSIGQVGDFDNAIDSGNMSDGGTGGYSTGTIVLTQGQTIYISVGQMGAQNAQKRGQKEYVTTEGNWNGGGGTKTTDADGDNYYGSGGGCTSIQTSLVGDGQLKNYESAQDNVLIVAGGGGGSAYYRNSNLNYHYGFGGAGGGLEGLESTHRYWSHTSTYDRSPIQNEIKGSFGTGATYNNEYTATAGGGGGWLGGTTHELVGGDGGSGHIGTMLMEGKTIAGNQTFKSPSGTDETGHTGNGYARITLVSVD